MYATTNNPLQGAPREFVSANISTLPFRCSTSPLPAFLRDGPDSGPKLKYLLNDPSYQLLDITPDVAVYLDHAVKDSRRMAHGNSSEMNRLAKTFD